MKSFEIDLLRDKYDAWALECRKSEARYEEDRLKMSLMANADFLIMCAEFLAAQGKLPKISRFP